MMWRKSNSAPEGSSRRAFFGQGIRTMMEALREGAKTWVAKVLLGLVIVVFAILGVSTMDINATIQGLFRQDLATVAGRPIAGESYRTELNNYLRQLGQQSGQNLSLEDARKLGLDKQVLDRMIAQTALDAQADRLGLSVGVDAAKAEIQSEPYFKNSKGQFEPGLLQNALRNLGMSEGAYVANIQQEMQRRSITGLAGENITLPRTLTDALVRYRDEKRDGRYVTFSVSEADVPQPTDDEIKTQYEATPAAYTAPEFRSVAVMKVEPADIASKINVSDEEIAGLYETSKEEYYQPEKRDIIQLSFPDVAAAEKVKARLDAGEDIMKIATELKFTDKDILFSGKLKGDFLDEKIGDAAFALAEGKVSAPVVGSLNTVLLKAYKVIAAHQPALDEIKETLKQRLQTEKASEEIQSIYAAVEDARAAQTKFEDIASKAGIPVIIAPAVSASGTDKSGQPVWLPAPDQLLKAIYETDVGLETDALQTDHGYVWFEVREVIPSAVKPLADVKTQVIADWKASKLRNLASEKAKSIVEKAGDSTKLETIATEVGGTIKSVTGLQRNNISEEFDGIATTALFSVPEKKLTWALEGDGKSARIIEVSKVTVPAGSATASAKEVSDAAKAGLRGDLLDSYIKAARGAADVSMNEELWRKISGTNTTP
jgi:peptidyl-prolyl cis-trans isomerase D